MLGDLGLPVGTQAAIRRLLTGSSRQDGPRFQRLGGHAAVGRRVLPSFRRDQLPGTPFGPPSVALSMVLFSWHAMTVTLLTIAGLLLSRIFLEVRGRPAELGRVP